MLDWSSIISCKNRLGTDRVRKCQHRRACGDERKSFWPLLNGNDYTPHDAIVVERNYHALDYDPIRAVRTKDFHYIRNFDTTTRRQCKPYEITNLKQLSQKDLDYTEAKPILFKEPEELYSIGHDVDEFHNLAEDKTHAKIK